MKKNFLAAILLNKLNLNLDEEISTSLDEILLDFIRDNIGFKFNNDYSEYETSVTIYLNNIIINSNKITEQNIIEITKNYINKYNELLNENENVKILLTALKARYTNDEKNISVSHFNEKLEIIMSKEDNDLINIPNSIIKNVKELNLTLSNYIETINNSSTLYKNSLYEINDDTKYQVFFWTLLNANIVEIRDLNDFFNRYIQYLNSTYYEKQLDYRPYGELHGDEIYFKYLKSDLAYETPYYCSFILVDNSDKIMYELPNIRAGFYLSEDNKVECQILAIQSSQKNSNLNLIEKMPKSFKYLIEKTKKYREFNPNHFVSIIIFLGMLESMNIETVTLSEYMPFRFKRFFNENLDKQELVNRQKRITKKMVNNFKKATIIFDNFVEGECLNEIDFKIVGKLSCKNTFLQQLIEIGNKIGSENIINKEYINTRKKN